jgi:hypothetical protein
MTQTDIEDTTRNFLGSVVHNNERNPMGLTPAVKRLAQKLNVWLKTLVYLGPIHHLGMRLVDMGSYDQISSKNNLREELFISLTLSEVSVHHGRESIIEQSSLHHSGQEAEKRQQEVAQGKMPPRTCPSNLLPLVRSHLIMFLIPLKIEPPRSSTQGTCGG